jgi:hypothetical protein
MGSYVGIQNAIVRATGSGNTTRGKAILVAICDADHTDRDPCAVDNCLTWDAPASGTPEEACLNLYQASEGCSASCL